MLDQSARQSLRSLSYPCCMRGPGAHASPDRIHHLRLAGCVLGRCSRCAPARRDGGRGRLAHDDGKRTGAFPPFTSCELLDFRHHETNIPPLIPAGGPASRPPRRLSLRGLRRRSAGCVLQRSCRLVPQSGDSRTDELYRSDDRERDDRECNRVLGQVLTLLVAHQLLHDGKHDSLLPGVSPTLTLPASPISTTTSRAAAPPAGVKNLP